jgi:hypothetical protein
MKLNDAAMDKVSALGGLVGRVLIAINFNSSVI